MGDFPFDAVGFDLDGTVLDTFRDLGAAVNHALEAGGFAPVAVDSSKDLIGGGAKLMLAKAVEQQGGLDEKEFRTLYKRMLRYYAEHNAVHTRPFDGMVETLETLRARGVRLSVVTNKFEQFARQILDRLELSSFFEAVIGGDTLGRGADGRYLAKPAPDPLHRAARLTQARAFAFVGDSSYDVKAARAAGYRVVVAAYGYCDAPADELGGDAVIASPRELIGALERLG